MNKNKAKKTDIDVDAKSVLLDGDDYLVLELLKWPGETDREAIQRILREAIEMPKLKEFVEKLGQQISKMMGESKDFVTITGIEDSLNSYKLDSPGREHYWPAREEIAVATDEGSDKLPDAKIIELPEKPVPVPEVQTIHAEDTKIEIEEPHEITKEAIVPPPVRPKIMKPKQGPSIPKENPRLIRELLSGTSQLKPTRNDKSFLKRYPKGSKEYEYEILRMKQALEGPWSEY